MAEIIGVTAWILAGIRWGDWKKWELYQPTYLLWDFEVTWLLHYKLAALFGEFLVFASTVLIYIGRFPSNRLKAIWGIAMWVAIYTLNELLLVNFGVFTYHHHWNPFDSFLFNILLFSMLLIYFKGSFLKDCGFFAFIK